MQSLADLNTSELVQMSVDALEKEKREMSEKLNVIGKRMDHLERAYRQAERPLLRADYERQQANDRIAHEEAWRSKLVALRERHATDLAAKRSLARAEPDRRSFAERLLEQANSAHAQALADARRKAEAEKEERRREVRERLENERLSKMEEERLRREAEEAEKLAEQRRQEGAFFFLSFFSRLIVSC
jgi:translation initiation factor 3 subunit A